MKLIVKADDFGYTKSYNDGTIDAIENGVVTVVDLMLDTPGAEDAMRRIRDYPWISVGWHGGHFWGRPVADVHLVPSMVNSEGKFKWRRDRSLQKTVVYEEALIEMRAEVERCISIMGRAPQFTEVNGDSAMDRARKEVCSEYGIKHGFDEIHAMGKTILADDEYKVCRIYKVDPGFQYPGASNPEVSRQLAKGEKVDYRDDIARLKKEYHPIDHFLNYLKTDADLTYLSSWHPGYCDDYIGNESSMAYCRDIDVANLCSIELKRWIIENHVELVNYEDAIYGFKNYQNHLRVIGSPLAFEPIK